MYKPETLHKPPIPEAVRRQSKKLGIITRVGLSLASISSLIYTERCIAQIDLGLQTPNKQIVAQLDDQEPAQARDFLRASVTFVDPATIKVYSDPAVINEKPTHLANFSKKSLVSGKSIGAQEAQEHLLESRSNYDSKGKLIAASITTNRNRLPSRVIPEINKLIETTGFHNPELGGLYEQLLRESFSLPRGTTCYSGTMEDGEVDKDQKAGLYTQCSIQVSKSDGDWNIEAQTQPNGKMSFSTYDTRTTSCSID